LRKATSFASAPTTPYGLESPISDIYAKVTIIGVNVSKLLVEIAPIVSTVATSKKLLTISVD